MSEHVHCSCLLQLQINDKLWSERCITTELHYNGRGSSVGSCNTWLAPIKV